MILKMVFLKTYAFWNYIYVATGHHLNHKSIQYIAKSHVAHIIMLVAIGKFRIILWNKCASNMFWQFSHTILLKQLILILLFYGYSSINKMSFMLSWKYMQIFKIKYAWINSLYSWSIQCTRNGISCRPAIWPFKRTPRHWSRSQMRMQLIWPMIVRLLIVYCSSIM